MTELSDRECGEIVAASLAPDRILSGIDGYEGSRPDVLLTTVDRILTDRVAAARAEGARDMRGKIEAAIDACEMCGNPHVLRELHHPGEAHDYRVHRHSGGCITWADPDDGHAYLRPNASAAVRALLADGGEPQ